MSHHARLADYLLAEKNWFHTWRSLAETVERLDSIRKKIRSEFAVDGGAFVTHRQAKGLREVWVLVKCANLMCISEIKLNKSDPPDAYFRRKGREIPAEVLEVIEPGRKRNLEYGLDALEFEMDPGENWVRRANLIPQAVRTEIEKKKAKSYPETTELFVYLNIDEYGIRQFEIEHFLREFLREDAAPFSSIHIRWKLKLYSSDGETFFDSSVPVDTEFEDDSLYEAIVQDRDD